MSRFPILDELAPEPEATVAVEHVRVHETDFLAGDEMCPPGHAVVRQCEHRPGVIGPMVWWPCPRATPENRFYYCGVPAKPSPPNSKGCAWDLSGPPDAPTLHPSVDCSGVGCGWHGHIVNGRITG